MECGQSAGRESGRDHPVWIGRPSMSVARVTAVYTDMPISGRRASRPGRHRHLRLGAYASQDHDDQRSFACRYEDPDIFPLLSL